jgi:hypothetical protein
VTAAGRVTLARRSFRCPRCGLTAYLLDLRVGLDGFLSPQATRLACLAAASWSFDVASDRLDEIAGLRIDDETIRRHCHRTADELGRQRSVCLRPLPAGGDIEFLTDGVMAPTRNGWRELKMALFQARERGEPAQVADWADRELPTPTASAAYAAVSEAETFAATWRSRAEGLGIDPDGPMTVLGDGAEWIWRAAGQFPAADHVLDIFHASQHLAATAAALHGEGTVEALDWLDRGRRSLLADGWPGLLDHIGTTATEALTAPVRDAVDGLIAYFAKHTERLGYYGRLRSGRSIGSGAVEGLARRMGRRLKIPGRGWRVEHLEGMATLIATTGTTEWAELWSRPAA